MKKYFWILAVTAFLHASDQEDLGHFDRGYTPEIARAAHSPAKLAFIKKRTITPIGSLNSFGQAVTLYPPVIGTQKVIEAGYSYQQVTSTNAQGTNVTNTYAMVCLVRYNSNGTLDRTFNPRGTMPAGVTRKGVPGEVLTDLGQGSFATGVVIQPDQKAVVCGYRYNPTTFQYDFFVARYNVNGSLDTTFNPKGALFPGVVVTSISSGYDLAFGLILETGRILLFGSASRQIGTVAYTNGVVGIPDGTLDITWNSNGTTPGIATFSVLGTPTNGFDIAYGGISFPYFTIPFVRKIILVGQGSTGTSNNKIILMSLNENGTLNVNTGDPGFFGTYPFLGSGMVVTQIHSYDDAGYAITVGSSILGGSGTIAITGSTASSKTFSIPFNYRGFLITYGSDGKLPISSSGNTNTPGITVMNIPNGNVFDQPRAITYDNGLAPGGNFVISGFSFAQGLNLKTACTESFAQNFYQIYRVFLTQYNYFGILNTNFGSVTNPGITFYTPQKADDKAYSHVLTPARSIVVGGATYNPCFARAIGNSTSFLTQYQFFMTQFTPLGILQTPIAID